MCKSATLPLFLNSQFSNDCIQADYAYLSSAISQI
nr:MAG TPA: hypothetical protein [Caudoviricetes sp.]